MPDIIHSHILGSALMPVGEGPFAIAHIGNTAGVMGAGFAKGLLTAFPRAADSYFWGAKHGSGLRLGEVCVDEINIGDRHGWCITLVAQTLNHLFPLSMPHLEDSIRFAERFAHNRHLKVHIPRIGSGLAKGHWSDIVQLIPSDWIIYTSPQEIERWPDDNYIIINPGTDAAGF